MVINMVIVSDNVERGEKAARQMADDLRKQFRGWTMIAHIRTNVNKLTDDSYARYTG